MPPKTFAAGFSWGAATASYQIEGGVHEGGRGESIWDRFAHTPGKTLNGETGDIACDHYHRWRSDVDLMKSLGIKAYRFSVAWPRILPTGTGTPNQAGIDFYSRLVDALLKAGIRPVPTLYHWDLPQSLEDAGGWPNPDTAAHFADYADACFAALGDRVEHWITLNEPWCTAFLGYYTGHHAPGRADLDDCLRAGNTLCLAHGLAVKRFRDRIPRGKIGITVNLSPGHAATESEADRAALARFEAQSNRWFLDPLHTGDYPAEMREFFGGRLPEFTDAQRNIITSPTDFIGVNYYSRTIVRDNPQAEWMGTGSVRAAGAKFTEMDWEIYPRGLYEILCWIRDTYGNPTLYVTENGAAFKDRLNPDGKIDDDDRVTFLRDHFRAAHDAIADGVRLAGYFPWSLMDNFEWAFGYSKRFGIVHVDYATQKRTPKLSADWYAQVIRQNAVSGED